MSEEGVSGTFVFLCFEHEPKVPARKQQETASIRTTLATTQTMIVRTSPMPRRFFFSSHHSVGMAVGAGETDGAAVVGDAEGAGEGETDGAAVGAGVVGAGEGETDGTAVVGDAVGAGEIVGAGDGNGQLTPLTPRPQSVDSHRVL